MSPLPPPSPEDFTVQPPCPLSMQLVPDTHLAKSGSCPPSTRPSSPLSEQPTSTTHHTTAEPFSLSAPIYHLSSSSMNSAVEFINRHTPRYDMAAPHPEDMTFYDKLHITSQSRDEKRDDAIKEFLRGLQWRLAVQESFFEAWEVLIRSGAILTQAITTPIEWPPRSQRFAKIISLLERFELGAQCG
ncbi:hypothetical protein P280DRAFT_96161 [Massarina eburnea CBS 473.64]|uniref:Uncharacterized protein n=1 Tax=Massarina eburnea CBS 473.64 TaxID=1395130 RepID=A0A6A6RRQ7_9PLEO|nr:hypothetical protein P280DRAFT_96161 [Massarina eburnea CBS 473.64]